MIDGRVPSASGCRGPNSWLLGVKIPAAALTSVRAVIFLGTSSIRDGAVVSLRVFSGLLSVGSVQRERRTRHDTVRVKM